MGSKIAANPTISQAVEIFIRQIDGLRDGLPVAMAAIQASHRYAHDAYDDFIEHKCAKSTRDGKSMLLVPSALITQFETLSRELSKSFSAYDIVARSFLVSLVSQYDAFLSRLVRALIVFMPHALNKIEEKLDSRSEKSLSYTDLLKFSSIEDAREHVISEAVENLLRKSHKDQFGWLEKKFSIELRKDLSAWPKFIEITQRRNLFVHCDGIVTKQYIAKCKEDHVAFAPEPKLGEELSISQEYFNDAHEVIYEIGVKLSQVLWRKIAPTELKKADTELNQISYELIRSENYQLGSTLLDFGCEILKKHVNDKTEKMLVVNRANAYKLSGKIDRASKIMAAHDWTATGDDFQLAAAAIRDDLDEVLRLMKKIGNQSEDVDARSYREWPLFKSIRTQPKFMATFKKIFREPLIPENIEMKDMPEHKHEDDVDSLVVKRKGRTSKKSGLTKKGPTIH